MRLCLLLTLLLLLRHRRGGEICAVLVDGDASIAPEGLHKASGGLGGGRVCVAASSIMPLPSPNALARLSRLHGSWPRRSLHGQTPPWPSLTLPLIRRRRRRGATVALARRGLPTMSALSS